MHGTVVYIGNGLEWMNGNVCMDEVVETGE